MKQKLKSSSSAKLAWHLYATMRCLFEQSYHIHVEHMQFNFFRRTLEYFFLNLARIVRFAHHNKIRYDDIICHFGQIYLLFCRAMYLFSVRLEKRNAENETKTTTTTHMQINRNRCAASKRILKTIAIAHFNISFSYLLLLLFLCFSLWCVSLCCDGCSELVFVFIFSFEFTIFSTCKQMMVEAIFHLNSV